MTPTIASLSTFLFFVGILSMATAFHPWENNTLVYSSRDPEILRRLRALTQDVRARGCDINICFALQGNNFITEEKFQAQKDFVDLIVAITGADDTGSYCAVQYGRTTSVISALTGSKIRFLNRVARAIQVGGFRSNIAAALGYIAFQLRCGIEGANHVIIMGDETITLRSRILADMIRGRMRISAVAVGGFSTVDLVSITGDSNRIFEIDSFFDLAEIVVGFVNDICNL